MLKRQKGKNIALLEMSLMNKIIIRTIEMKIDIFFYLQTYQFILEYRDKNISKR